jgi:hypothetical protein
MDDMEHDEGRMQYESSKENDEFVHMNTRIEGVAGVRICNDYHAKARWLAVTIF